MKEFEVWLEGYSATGEHSPAQCLGKVSAETFDEACIKLAGNKLDKNPDGSYRRGPYRGKPLPPSKDRAQKMAGNYTIWACQLFDNKDEAARSFG